jgi:hypothetical protein
VHYYAPSYTQAKRVAWEYVLGYLAGTGTVFNQAELKATMPNGVSLQLGSADNPDSSRGIYSDYVVLDEPAQMPSRMWSEVLRPALSDRLGGAMFIGTPAGRHGLFYDSYAGAADDAEWWRGMYKASETGIIDQTELDAARRVMTLAQYNQEFECSFDAAIMGAYWGERMSEIEAKGHMRPVMHDPSKLVYTGWDLGVSDATAIWFWQYNGNELLFIDHEEYTNQGFPEIVAELKAKGYQYGRAVIPHDGGNRSLSTGLKRSTTLNNLGLQTVIAPKAQNQGDIADHIDVARTVLRRCFFDPVKCKYGLECLRQYKSVWDDKKGVARIAPDHDWTSHSADAFRYLATTPTNHITDDWSGDLVYESDRRM